MLNEIMNQITRISNTEEVNHQNYLESLGYVENAYRFINKLKLAIPVSDISFLPTFKGVNTCQRFNIDSNTEENEMRYFIVVLPELFEDYEKIKENIRDTLGNICTLIEYGENTISFIMN